MALKPVPKIADICPHDDRIANVEQGILNLHNAVSGIDSKLETVIANQETIAALNTTVNNVWDFTRKHGSKILAFGAGIMSAAGMGNPAIWHFISNFSWH